jgi:heme/copper-type cytochrome/quinol oxidase subunit 2
LLLCDRFKAVIHYFAKYRGLVKKATYFADNNKLEFIWSSIPAIVLAVLIFYGLYAWTDIMFVNEEEEKTYCYRDCTHNSSNGLLDILGR